MKFGENVEIDQFIRDREDWAGLIVFETNGQFGVALTLDGAYSLREDAEAVADLFKKELTQ